MRHTTHPLISLKLKGWLSRIWCYRTYGSLPGGKNGHVLHLDRPGGTGTSLSALDVAATEHAQSRHFANADGLSSGVECNLATLGPLAVTIDLNLIVFAEAAHALLGPTIAVTGGLAGAVEQPCDLPIRHQPGQFANERYCILGNTRILPAGRIQSLIDLQCGVASTLPVQDCVNDRAVPADDNLIERCAQDALARRRSGGPVRSRSAPSCSSCCRSWSPNDGARRAMVAAISPSIL